METNETKNKSKSVLILLIISVLGNLVLGYKFFTEKKAKEIVTIEKEATQSDLDSIIDIRVALESELNNTKNDLDKCKRTTCC
jgi:regulatory protein YycI of two-component signal transduction system YycFG